jgi:hypothetical protein
MAQTLKSKVRKLAEQFNIDAIVKAAKEVQFDIQDEQDWKRMSNDEKLKWFLEVCDKNNLTVKINGHQISVNELPVTGTHLGTKAYFCAFLPRENQNENFHLEIGSAFASAKHGEIWYTNPGKVGKEKQIAEVIRLNKLGK